MLIYIYVLNFIYLICLITFVCTVKSNQTSVKRKQRSTLDEKEDNLKIRKQKTTVDTKEDLKKLKIRNQRSTLDGKEDLKIRNQRITLDGKEDFKIRNQRITLDGKEDFKIRNQRIALDEKEDFKIRNQRITLDGKEDLKTRKQRSTFNWKEDLIVLENMSKRKLPPSSSNPNHEFCEFLTELADYERNMNKNIFKSNAYGKAAASLAKLPNKINSGKEALKLEGIGKSIAAKIDEFIETGKLRKIDVIREDSTVKPLLELTRITGIGPAKAKTLIEQGIKTIEDLRKHEDLLTHHQVIGLKYFEDFEKKIPRKEVRKIEKIVKRKVEKLDPKFELTVCGSYRRGLPECGDIDILLTHPEYVSESKNEPKNVSKKDSSKLLKKVVDELIRCDIIKETLAHGDTKFMGACSTNNIMRRIDIRLIPYDQYHCGVLYFTGSDVFNKEMRKHALNNSFTLNEYTLRRLVAPGVIGDPLPINSEKHIFEHIGYPYKTPEERQL